MIIVAGMPATGKSTIARQLQKHFGFPILEKDSIKEALFDTIGFEGYSAKRLLDVASNEILLRQIQVMIHSQTSLIVDNNFDETAAEKLSQLLIENPVNAVTVFLEGDPEVLFERYSLRDSTGKRHPGHAMQTNYPPHAGESQAFSMTRDGFDERFINRKMDKLIWGGPQIRIDATWPEKIDIQALINKIEYILK